MAIFHSPLNSRESRCCCFVDLKNQIDIFLTPKLLLDHNIHNNNKKLGVAVDRHCPTTGAEQE